MKKICILFLLLTVPFLAFSQGKRAFKKEIKKYRKHYKKEFLEEGRSPFYGDKKGMKKMRFFKADKNYQVTGTFQRTPDAQSFKMATYSGITKDYRLYGYVNVTIDGKPVKVHLYQNLRIIKMEEYKNNLFIPFKDLTNDGSTYGGGRYIDANINDIKDGKMTIDFNRCYNPWCAYSDGYNCPIPPIENHFEIEITAGEKNFKGKKKKRPPSKS